MRSRLKWWVLTKLHRPFIHRTGDQPCWLCGLAWQQLLELRSFVDELHSGQAQIESGSGTPFRYVRRDR